MSLSYYIRLIIAVACWPAQDGVYLTNNATRYALRKNSCVPGSWRDVNGTLTLVLPACRLARAMSLSSVRLRVSRVSSGHADVRAQAYYNSIITAHRGRVLTVLGDVLFDGDV